MRIIKSIARMRKLSSGLKKKSKIIGFVPTMGYFHEGHLSLIRKSLKECNVTIISIYVNPLQFGPKEDFNRYPRDLNRDIDIVKRIGGDYLFIPEDKDMYPEKYLTTIDIDGITNILCGASRPGHFKGVATVVNKLFNIVSPDIAYFGRKDYQQAIIIKKMVKDLNMPAKIKILPIVREPDGLAMSSRNIYLTLEERKQAVVLYESLKLAGKLIQNGQRDSDEIIKQMKRLISRYKFAKIDYINIVTEDLSCLDKIEGKILIALAVFIGKVRLIDNMILQV